MPYDEESNDDVSLSLFRGSISCVKVFVDAYDIRRFMCLCGCTKAWMVWPYGAILSGNIVWRKTLFASFAFLFPVQNVLNLQAFFHSLLSYFFLSTCICLSVYLSICLFFFSFHSSLVLLVRIYM